MSRNASTPRTGSILCSVTDSGGRNGPLKGAWVCLYQDRNRDDVGQAFEAVTWQPDAGAQPICQRTDADGEIRFTDLAPAAYVLQYQHYPLVDPVRVRVHAGCAETVCFHPQLDVDVGIAFKGPDCNDTPCEVPRKGDIAYVTVGFTDDGSAELRQHVSLLPPPGARLLRDQPYAFSMPIRRTGPQTIESVLRFGTRPGAPGAVPPRALAEHRTSDEIEADERPATPVSGNINVSMTRTETEPTSDLKLYREIQRSVQALSFDNYYRYMKALFCGDGEGVSKRGLNRLLRRRFLPFTDTDAYRVMKAATEAFVMLNCGTVFDEPGFGDERPGRTDFESWLDRRDLPPPDQTPYLEEVDGVEMLPYLAIIRSKLPDIPIIQSQRIGGADIDLCDGIIQSKLRNPCLIELIWSYWHEEGMLVQTMNAITRRFQNVRGLHSLDPLANLEVNPLRPLNNLLWGHIQDEQHRLTVLRRNAEYDHHYGLRLEGRAVRGFQGADTRSKFIEAFHHLLRLCTVFFKQDDDTTVKADAFGVLNALKEVHLILSQGAHSQFGDLPSTARAEMLMQQWLLSRDEFREFLPTRIMVAYPEPWMDRVDAMKKLQGWTDTSVMHFHNLAAFGEEILLAIRWGAWSKVFEPTQAFNFARNFRPQIQGYIHAYRAATGVELGAETVDVGVDATLPSVLLQKRLSAQRRSA